jgi:hypothetical protein
MHQFARNNDEREHGSRQLYDAYADTVATESKLRAITLHEEETLRKGLVQDLQNQLNLHLSAANACLAGAVSAAVGEGEEEKYAGVMQALQSIATAQKRQHDLSQQFRELRNRLDDVLTNATPHPGSLNNERGKRRRARDRLRQQLPKLLHACAWLPLLSDMARTYAYCATSGRGGHAISVSTTPRTFHASAAIAARSPAVLPPAPSLPPLPPLPPPLRVAKIACFNAVRASLTRSPEGSELAPCWPFSSTSS